MLYLSRSGLTANSFTVPSLSYNPPLCCRSREKKGSHDLCRWCRVPPGLPHPGCRGRPRDPAVPRQHQRGVHVILAGPPPQRSGRQEPGGTEQHPQGGHRRSAKCADGSPEKQILQQPRGHVTGLRCCWTTGDFPVNTPNTWCSALLPW